MNGRNFSLLGASYFFVLFNYPLVRASTTTLFVEVFGAKASPKGWLLAVLLLILAVACCNRLQARVGFHRTFALISGTSALIFILGYGGHRAGYSNASFLMFAWKEVYIVLQIHLLLAYANSWLKRPDFLKWIGPLGALGSLGGVAGGLLTSEVARRFGTGATLITGQVFLICAALLTLGLDKIPGTIALKDKDSSPLQSLNTPELKRFVAMVAAIVALSQVVINIADFQFGLVFEAVIQESQARTAYLGNVYTVTNAVTLFLQLLILPLLLRYLGLRSLHLFIPLSYLMSLGFGLNGSALWVSAAFYCYLKACDYSLFSAGKELWYHPLAPLQKYGAKYLTDMFVYRAAKAGIAGVLIYWQSAEMLLAMMVTALVAWLLLAVLTFSQYRRIFAK